MKVISVRKYLTGDIDVPKGTPLSDRLAFKQLLRRLAAAARDCGEKWNVIDGYRPYADQVRLYKLYLAGKGNLAAVPGTSNHGHGKAADVSVTAGGGPVGSTQRRINALKKHGLCLPVHGEKWHVEIGTHFA